MILRYKRRVFGLVSVLLTALPASAQFHTWVGGSGSNWSTQANWDPIALPLSSSGTTLNFPRTSTNNDLPGTFFVGNLFVAPLTGGPMTFSGNPIRFAGNVSNLGVIFLEDFVGNSLNIQFNTQVEVAGGMLLSPSSITNFQFNRPFLAGSNAITIQSGGTVSIFAANSSAGKLELLSSSTLIVGLGSSTFISPPNIGFADGTFRSAGGLPEIRDLEFSNGSNVAKAVFQPVLLGNSVQLNGNILLDGSNAELSGPITLGTGPHLISGDAPGRFLTITSPVDGPGSFIVSSTNLTFSDNTTGTAKHTYTGVTSLFGPSSLTVTHSSVLSPSTAMFLDIPASLDISGTTQKIGDILSLGSINLTGGVLDVGSATMPPGSQITGTVNASGGRLIKSGSRDFLFAPSSLTALGNSLSLQVNSGRLITTLPTGTGRLEIAPDAIATIDLTGTQSYAGIITGRPAGPGTLEKTGPGQLILLPDITQPIHLSNLIITGGQLSTTHNDLIINYSGSSPLPTLIDYIASNTLLASQDVGGVPTLLVLFEAADLDLSQFEGIPVDATTVIGKFTYTGDANLDGYVDAFDYAKVDDNFGQPGTFITGDLNQDGQVDAFDYASIDDTFGAGIGNPLRPPLSAASTEVFIPEPSSMGLLALATCLLARRRR